MVVSYIFSFHPYLGKIPILTNIFQMGGSTIYVFSAKYFLSQTVNDCTSTLMGQKSVPMLQFQCIFHASTSTLGSLCTLRRDFVTNPATNRLNRCLFRNKPSPTSLNTKKTATRAGSKEGLAMGKLEVHRRTIEMVYMVEADWPGVGFFHASV